MIGILIQLALTWLLAWLFEKGNLSVLGLMPSKRRLSDFFFFFLLAAGCSSSVFLMQHLIAQQSWKLNPDLSWNVVAEGLWWNLKSVLFEELIFRGVLFYILLKKLGMLKAILISATAFGIYHWFSHEVLGDPMQMLITFVTTGIMGAVYAYGYAKSWSLYIPIALHLGWNAVQSVVFSNTVIGKQLLIRTAPDVEVTVSYAAYFTMLLLPMLLIWGLGFWLLKKRKQDDPPVFNNFI